MKETTKKLKSQFNKGPESAQENAAPMSKEDTIKYYEENVPFMKMQDEYEELMYKFHERKVKNIELQVRELEAIGYLAQWKAGQDDAKRRQEQEEEMKAQWDAMTPEQQEEWKQRAKENLAEIEKQAAASSINHQMD